MTFDFRLWGVMMGGMIDLIYFVLKAVLVLFIIGVIWNVIDSLVIEPVLRYFGRKASKY